MTPPLTRLLEHVLAGEPELGDEVEAVFREADRVRRRRVRTLAASGAVAVAVLAAAGYLLSATLMPASRTATPAPAPPVTPAAPVTTARPTAGTSAMTEPSAVSDGVLALIAPVVDGKKLSIHPKSPGRGNGWRQYSVVDEDGNSRGTVKVAVYTVVEDLCFPVLAAPGKCARSSWAPAGIEYVRYDNQDVDRQVRQTIARRISDGRTVALLAAGERDTGSASKGKPSLTGKQVEQIGTDRRIFDAFGPAERCSGPSSGGCPTFKVPVPVSAGD